jgi:predicted ATPase
MQGAPAGEIEAAYADALTCTRERRARSFELRGTTSYAHWLQDHQRGVEAYQLLAPLYATFTGGFDTRDVREARERLAELGGTTLDAVRRFELTSRRRRG